MEAIRVHQRKPPIKREIEIDVTSYAQGTQAAEPQPGKNFSPEYEPQRSISVFNQIRQNPSNRIRSIQRLAQQEQEEEQEAFIRLEIGVKEWTW